MNEVEQGLTQALAHAEKLRIPCERAATTSECLFLEPDESLWCARCTEATSIDKHLEDDLVLLANAYATQQAAVKELVEAAEKALEFLVTLHWDGDEVENLRAVLAKVEKE